MPRSHAVTALAVACLLPSCASMQGKRVGGELSLYPAGVITALHAQVPAGERDVFVGRLAGNFTDRQDFGEHDDESGDGFGGGVGWRRYERADHTGWLYGARLDVWKFDIDWRDDNPARRGNSDTITLQPAAEVGYGFELSPQWSVDLTVSLGAEINVETDGEDVGEGAILLVGATFLYSL